MEDNIKSLIGAAQHIVVIQADNPDADSLGSALALEQILGNLGKDITMYCGVTMPEYLRHLLGWDRVVDSLPNQFDASIIVDASTYTLLERLDTAGQLSWVKSKPCIVLDHHATVERPLDFTDVQIIDGQAASTGEIIFTLANKLSWTVDAVSGGFIMSSILGDTQGLTNELTTAQTYRVMAELTDIGVNRPALEEARREYSKMPEKIYRYKAVLLARTSFTHDTQIASVRIPQSEIYEFSPLYNPAPLIQTDMLQTRDVALAIVFKTYDDGRITAALRSNSGYPVCGKLAESLGGGGHAHAAGFKVTDGRDYDTVYNACMKRAGELLDELTHEIDA